MRAHRRKTQIINYFNSVNLKAIQIKALPNPKIKKENIIN